MIFIQRVVCFLFPSLGELDKNHITSQTMGDSFLSHIYHPIPVFLTLFFKWRGIGIHNVIIEIYHMSVITLISGKICDKTDVLFVECRKAHEAGVVRTT
jgi:hypothetical protein